MKTISIKTYNPNSPASPYQFYILSKGYNSGKPLENPCPNCFVIQAKDAEEKGKLFWICYSLWKAGTYIPLLYGSVIPFIRIKDVTIEIKKGIERMTVQPARFDKYISQMQQLMHTEELLQMQLKLISKIKTLTCRKMNKGEDFITSASTAIVSKGGRIERN